MLADSSSERATCSTIWLGDHFPGARGAVHAVLVRWPARSNYWIASLLALSAVLISVIMSSVTQNATPIVLDVKKSPVERLHLTFERFADDLVEGLSSDGSGDAERSLLTEEVMIGCTLGMLQCLDRPHRLAYLFGEIFELPGPEAADALGITPALFRKRRQHARTAIMSFTRTYCGLASDTAACACHRRVPAALRGGRIREDALAFANDERSYRETRSFVRRVQEARWALEVHRSNHPRASSIDFARRLVQALEKTP